MAALPVAAAIIDPLLQPGKTTEGGEDVEDGGAAAKEAEHEKSSVPWFDAAEASQLARLAWPIR